MVCQDIEDCLETPPPLPILPFCHFSVFQSPHKTPRSLLFFLAITSSSVKNLLSCWSYENILKKLIQINFVIYQIVNFFNGKNSKIQNLNVSAFSNFLCSLQIFLLLQEQLFLPSNKLFLWNDMASYKLVYYDKNVCE